MNAETEWLVPGWASDVDSPPQLSDILRCMAGMRLHRPVQIELTIRGPKYKDLDDEDVVLCVVPTALRVILDWTDECKTVRFEEPSYEFEGWLVKPPFVVDQRPIWIRGELKTQGPGDSGENNAITECTVYVLESGSEMGVRHRPISGCSE